MAYDADLAERIRDALAGVPDVSERKMFGGIAFMVGDHMALGVYGTDLMARLGRDGAAEAAAGERARPMEMAGRTMKGYVLVDAAGLEDDAALESWVARCVEHAESLPPK